MRIGVAEKEFFPYAMAVTAVDLTAFGCARLFPRYYLLFTIVILLCLAAFAFLAFFFRDPDREIMVKEGTVLAPADGKVLIVAEAEEPVYLKSKARQVSIFMSPLNMHVQHAPVSGKVEYLQHKSGRFFRAYLDRASIENEQNQFGFNCSGQKFLVKQIAGIIARRTVAWVREGEEVTTGQRIGIVKFGSRVDIFVPMTVELTVRKGDRVKAGLTILGKSA